MDGLDAGRANSHRRHYQIFAGPLHCITAERHRRNDPVNPTQRLKRVRVVIVHRVTAHRLSSKGITSIVLYSIVTQFALLPPSYRMKFAYAPFPCYTY